MPIEKSLEKIAAELELIRKELQKPGPPEPVVRNLDTVNILTLNISQVDTPHS